MFTYQQSPYGLILLLVSIVVALFALTRWRLRHIRPTAGPGALLLSCGSIWMLTNALEMRSLDPQSAFFWNRMQNVGIIPVPALWLIMALQFTGYDRILTRQRLFLLCIVPFIGLILALTNDYHQLFMSTLRFEVTDSIGHVTGDVGLFFVLIYLYGYLIVLLGAYLLVRRLSHSQGFRWQGSIVLLGVVISVGANILDWSRLSPIPQIKLTPLALVISIPLFVVTLIRARRADILPIARSNVIDTMQDAVLVLDIENRIIDMNPAAESIVGQRLREIVGKPIGETWLEWARQVDLPPPNSRNLKELHLSEVNRQRIFDMRQSELCDGHGQRIGHVIVLREITERTRNERALQLSEEYFRALTENSTDVTIITNMEGAIQYVSPSLERIFLRSRDEVIGKNTLEFIHPDDVNHFLKTISDALMEQKGSVSITARFHDKDGNWHVLECVAGNMLNHPAINGIVVNARDVTEREAVAEALRQSEERYRLHFANINDVVYSFDSQLKLLSAAPSIERHLGVKPEEFVGKSILELNVLPSEYLEKAAIEASQVLAGKRIEGTIYEFIAKDGSRKIAEISSSPIFQDAKVVATVNVARDITERVHADERLRASLREKEVLLKEIHHRVKNNLQIISSLLNLQAANLHDPFALAHFQDSQHRIRSMALIHERLYRSGDLAHVDFQEYLHDLTGHLLQSYRAQTNEVVLKIKVDDIYLDIDTAIPCGLIVNELVSNALKHAFPDARSGVIGVEMFCTDDGQTRLIVGDNGIGMPSDVDLLHSTSLGLQLVASLTKQLGGTISVCGNTGTTVTVSFSSSKKVDKAQETKAFKLDSTNLQVSI